MLTQTTMKLKTSRRRAGSLPKNFGVYESIRFKVTCSLSWSAGKVLLYILRDVDITFLFKSTLFAVSCRCVKNVFLVGLNGEYPKRREIDFDYTDLRYWIFNLLFSHKLGLSAFMCLGIGAHVNAWCHSKEYRMRVIMDILSSKRSWYFKLTSTYDTENIWIESTYHRKCIFHV